MLDTYEIGEKKVDKKPTKDILDLFLSTSTFRRRFPFVRGNHDSRLTKKIVDHDQIPAPHSHPLYPSSALTLGVFE
jgi:hypothetical protein